VRRLLLAAVAVLALVGAASAVPAQTPPPPPPPPAEGTTCRYQPPAPKLSARERRIRAAIAVRREFGLPRGRALVERLDRIRASLPRVKDIFPAIPLRAREVAFFDGLDRFAADPDVERAIRLVRRAPGLSGGVSFGHDYPSGGHLVIRVTRPLTARERAAIARLVPRLRIRRVVRSERALRAQQDRIDVDALRAEGIDVSETGVDTDRNAVRVRFASDRPDAEAVIQRRYGPGLVLVRVAALRPTCTAPDAYVASADDRTLTLRYTTSGSVDPALTRVQLRELGDRVSVAVVEQSPPARTADAVVREVGVALAQPLAGRRVISTLTRREVRRAPPGG